MKHAHGRKFASSERGAVTIEFVCTVPLFLAALAFAFEFGQFFLAHQSTVHNVRAASRYLSRTDVASADRTRARTIVRTGQISNGTAPDYLADADIDIELEDVIDVGPDTPQVRIWKISARIDYEPILFGFIGGENITLPFVVREDFRAVRY